MTQRRARPDRPEPGPAAPLRRAAVSPKQALAVLCAYETLIGHLVATNNALLQRLEAEGDATPKQGAIFNEWSKLCNDLFDAHCVAVEQLTKPLN